MWSVLLVGVVVGLATAAWVVLRRRARAAQVPAMVREFLRELGEHLEARDARLSGVVPGRFTGIVEIDGQETPVPLYPLLRHWEAFPTDMDRVVSRLTREIREEGLDRPGDFEFAEYASDLLPQVRSLEWIRAHSPAFGDGRLVHRPLGPDLAVCYVIDDAWSMVFVCEGHLRCWGRTEADLFSLARQNLRHRTDRETAQRIEGGEPTVLRTGDGYAAARLVLLDGDAAPGDLLVALPDRDVLWLGDAGGEDLGDLMSRNAEECSRSARPVSPKLYRVSAGELMDVVN